MNESNLIADAISTLRKALTCRSCERPPRQDKESRFSPTNAKCYNGPLLASFECGCMFCRKCYHIAVSSTDNRTASSNIHAIGTTTVFTCPICQSKCKQMPHPFLPWMADENKELPVSIGSSNVENENLDQLNEFLEIICPTLESITDTSVNSETLLDPSCSQVDESEVPGTCLPLTIGVNSTAQYQLMQQDRSVPDQSGNEMKRLSQFSDTEEVPGTCLSFHDRQRLQAPARHDSQMDPYKTDATPYIETCGYTETIPGTCVSYLDRQRIQQANNSQMQHHNPEAIDSTMPCVHTFGRADTDSGKDASCFDRRRMEPINSQVHSNVPAASEQYEIYDQTEEVPGTLISFIGQQRTAAASNTSSPNLYLNNADDSLCCDELNGGQADEVFDTHASFYERHRAASNVQTRQNEKHSTYRSIAFSEMQTEEVPGTCVSYLDRRRRETAHEMSTKRRRVTASPVKAATYGPQSMLSMASNSADSEESSSISQLFVAVDVLDSMEASALELFNEQGHCVVVNEVHNVSNDHSVPVPFPPILVTRAVTKPGSKTVCLRSYRYLRALALGAHVIDAKWLSDSKQAGTLLDCSPYIVCYDSLLLSDKPRPSLLTGLQFACFCACNETHSEMSSLGAQVGFRTKSMTSQQISKLVTCCGGTCTVSAFVGTSDAILVPDKRSLKCIVNELRIRIRLIRAINKWYIEKYDGSREIKTTQTNGTLHLPLIKTKWLEDSICAGSRLDLSSKYCYGFLRVQYQPPSFSVYTC